MISSTGSAGSILEMATAASLWLYPRDTSAAMAWAPVWPPAAADTPERSSSTAEPAAPLATLSFNSSTMRWASLGPTPLAALKALWSPADTAR